jgi:predicted ABC-type ATPase
MIINITGPNGSGKSTLVHKLLGDATLVTEHKDSNDKIYGYSFKIGKRKIGIVGRYITACGGCDSISSQKEVRRLVKKFAESHDHVIFEGVIVSTCFNTYHKFLQTLEKPFTFFILLPPVDTCIARVKKRRAARGDDLNFNEDNLRSKHRYITNVAERCANEEIPHVFWNKKASASDALRELLK